MTEEITDCRRRDGPFLFLPSRAPVPRARVSLLAPESGVISSPIIIRTDVTRRDYLPPRLGFFEWIWNLTPPGPIFLHFKIICVTNSQK